MDAVVRAYLKAQGKTSGCWADVPPELLDSIFYLNALYRNKDNELYQHFHGEFSCFRYSDNRFKGRKGDENYFALYKRWAYENNLLFLLNDILEAAINQLNLEEKKTGADPQIADQQGQTAESLAAQLGLDDSWKPIAQPPLGQKPKDAQIGKATPKSDLPAAQNQLPENPYRLFQKNTGKTNPPKRHTATTVFLSCAYSVVGIVLCTTTMMNPLAVTAVVCIGLALLAARLGFLKPRSVSEKAPEGILGYLGYRGESRHANSKPAMASP